MNINLNNYESIFLMYVDNELSIAERLFVERFIQEYPYLKEELAVLQEMVLPVEEDIVFDKNNLYRFAAFGNLEESMLLHLDAELDEKNKMLLLQQIESDNTAKESWELLQKTKLDITEHIIFPDKTTLYRSEGGKIIVGRFAKWAVAAALIAAGFYIGISVIKKQEKIPQGISKNESKIIIHQQLSIAPEDNHTNNSVSDSLPSQKSIVVDNSLAENTKVEEAFKNVRTKLKEQKNEMNLTRNKNGIGQKQQLGGELEVNLPSNALATNSEKINIRRFEADDINANITALANIQKPQIRKEILDVEIKPLQNSFAITTAMNNNEEINDNHILFMDEATVSQSKAGIFFKKLKRTVARTTNIKTGSSLKIAGFEFAVK
ncbi:MAG: hypothetical protein ACOYLO_08450 [Ferruginibacter sp.]